VKDPKGWCATDKFTVVLETAGLNATELSAYCRERGLFPEQVSRWRQAAQDANAKPLLAGCFPSLLVTIHFQPCLLTALHELVECRQT
jgi:hypothetical protein